MTTSPGGQAASSELFRALLGRFASGVTVVTTLDAEGRAHGMTVSAFSALSLEPPLVLVCVAHAASMLGVLDAATHFAVNILSEEQEALSRRFADEAMELRFDGVEYARGAGGVPVLAHTVATIACRRHDRHDVGDHAIFIGEVVEGRVDGDRRPLVYHRGAYGRLAR